MATVTITYQEYEELKKAATINVEQVRNETVLKLEAQIVVLNGWIDIYKEKENRPWYKKLFYFIVEIGSGIVK